MLLAILPQSWSWPWSKATPTPSPSVEAQTVAPTPSPSFSPTPSESLIQSSRNASENQWTVDPETGRAVRVVSDPAMSKVTLIVQETLAQNSVSLDEKITKVAEEALAGATAAGEAVVETKAYLIIDNATANATVNATANATADGTVLSISLPINATSASSFLACAKSKVASVFRGAFSSHTGVAVVCGVNTYLMGREWWMEFDKRIYDRKFYFYAGMTALNAAVVVMEAASIVNTIRANILPC